MLNKEYLTTPVPIQTLVWLRIALGLLGGGDILGNGIYYHWYLNHFENFTFRYYGFEWVYPLPEPFFSLFFIVGFLAGIAVAIGYKFRLAAPTLAICFTYLFLLEKAHYLNHAYLFSWLAWLLIFTPAWREFSIDVWQNPAERSRLIPRWSVAIFPLLMGIVYFFGGIAKMNADWLLHASPLHSWISSRSDTLLIGPLLKYKTTAYFMAWGGFLLDLTIAFFLLHKRLRWWALAAAIFFHFCNHLIFNIGIFPYLSLILTSLWFEPDWPGKFINWLAKKWTFINRLQQQWQQHFFDYRSSKVDGEDEARLPKLTYTAHNPFKGKTLATYEWGDENSQTIVCQPAATFKFYDRAVWSKPIAGLLLFVVAFHLLYPLRHHLIAGDVAWTEEGHRYSWRMMLRSKNGTGSFRVVDKESGTTQKVYPHNELTKRQARKLYTHPDMILQYAHYLADNCEKETSGKCEVYADISVRLNNGKYHTYIDPEIDLSNIQWTWLNRKIWVLSEEE